MKHHRCNVAFWFETKARGDSTELSKRIKIHFQNSNIINALFSCKETGQDVRVKVIDVTCMFQNACNNDNSKSDKSLPSGARGEFDEILSNHLLFKLAPHIEGIRRKMASLTNFAVEWGNYGKKLFISSHDLDFRHVDTSCFGDYWEYCGLFLRILPFICALLSNKGQYNMKHKTP